MIRYNNVWFWHSAVVSSWFVDVFFVFLQGWCLALQLKSVKCPVWILACEMNVVINGIEVFKEGIFLCSLDDGESITHKPFPECRGGIAVARALVSRSSINKFATIGLMGDSIAAPLTCSYIFPWKIK